MNSVVHHVPPSPRRSRGLAWHRGVPAAAEQKPVRLELGLLELGFLPRRAKPDTDLEVDDRRVVLPVSFSDAAPAQARDDLKGKGEKRKGSENAAVDR